MNLSHLAYYQIERLKDLRRSWMTTPDIELSINAAIQAYRAGALDADPRLISYWWKGQLVHGPSPDRIDDLEAKARQWAETYGPGQVHIEQVAINLPIQQAAVAVYEADNVTNYELGPEYSFHHVC